MNKKIIFLDIDGTLTEPGNNVPPESAIQAVAKARNRGHYVFLCTGRNYGMLSPLLQYGFDGFIGSAGGYIECQGEVIYDCPMTEEQRQTALRVLEENGIFRTIECKEDTYTDESFKEFLRGQSAKGGNSELLRWREQLEKNLNILPMQEYAGQPIYKIIVMSPSRERLIKPQEALKEDFAFCIQDEVDQQGVINGEIVNRKFDKGKGLVRVCEHLNLPLSDTIAMGDSMNDKEMLEIAGLSICMGNGNEQMKKLADVVCPSVAEDGIYRTFLKYHLIEE